MQSSHLFWPSRRKLFRQRSRLRGLMPRLVTVAAAVVAIVLWHAIWG